MKMFSIEGVISNILKWKSEVLEYRYHFIISLFLFGFASLLNFLSSNYIQSRGNAVASDLILNLVGPWNWQPVYTYGFIASAALVFIYPLFFNVRMFHLAASQMSLLVIIRSLFLPLTHLKAPLQQVQVEFPGFVSNFAFTNDLFFSGHVAVPFMAFFLFKGEKIRWLFLILALLMGTTVLVMHRHYSIDVFAALFIGYGSYKIGETFFSKVIGHSGKYR